MHGNPIREIDSSDVLLSASHIQSFITMLGGCVLERHNGVWLLCAHNMVASGNAKVFCYHIFLGRN